MMEWQLMDSAPKDGSYILAIVAPNESRHLEYHAGRAFVIRHGGFCDGYDMLWNVYPGFGGAPDAYFSHWMPLPEAPAKAMEARTGQDAKRLDATHDSAVAKPFAQMKGDL